MSHGQDVSPERTSHRIRQHLRLDVRCLIASLLYVVAILSCSRAHGQTVASTYTDLPASANSGATVATQGSPYLLTSSVAVRSTLNVSSDGAAPALFNLPLSEANQMYPINIAVSLCTGPANGIVPSVEANSSSPGRAALEESSLVRLYISTDANNPRPGPDSSHTGKMAYARGGSALITLNEDRSELIEEVWVAIWPPEEAWGETGTFEIEVLINLGSQCTQ